MDITTWIAANPTEYLVILFLAVLWTLPWKGVALWKSAKNGQKAWFVVLLLVNTLAILEILYLAFWQKKEYKFSRPAMSKKKNKKQ